MFRAICLTLVASTAQAALVESDWGPSVSTGEAELVFNSGRIEYVVDRITRPSNDAARSSWATTLTLDADWTVQAHVHIAGNPLAASQLASIGLSLARVGGQPHDFAFIELIHDGSGGRRVRSHIKRTESFGFVETQYLTGTDYILSLGYSASERLLRTFYQLAELQSESVDGWGVGPGEPLALQIVGRSLLMEVRPGQVYLTDFAFIPEPALTLWLALVPLLRRLRLCGRQRQDG